MKQLFIASVFTLGLVGGCATYKSVVVAQDGTTYVAKDDQLLFGLLNKIFVCKQGDKALTCTPVTPVP
jgi:hypothetical protein